MPRQVAVPLAVTYIRLCPNPDTVHHIRVGIAFGHGIMRLASHQFSARGSNAETVLALRTLVFLLSNHDNGVAAGQAGTIQPFAAVVLSQAVTYVDEVLTYTVTGRRLCENGSTQQAHSSSTSTTAREKAASVSRTLRRLHLPSHWLDSHDTDRIPLLVKALTSGVFPLLQYLHLGRMEIDHAHKYSPS